MLNTRILGAVATTRDDPDSDTQHQGSADSVGSVGSVGSVNSVGRRVGLGTPTRPSNLRIQTLVKLPTFYHVVEFDRIRRTNNLTGVSVSRIMLGGGSRKRKK